MGFSSWQKRQALKALVAQQNNRCVLCGHPFTEDRPATVDHIIPKSTKRAGLNHRSNLQAAHESCNQIRSSMPMDDFRAAVARGEIVLPDGNGARPTPLSKRARRGLKRLRAEIRFDVTATPSERVWRGEPRHESKEQRNARLRSEVDAHLSE